MKKNIIFGKIVTEMEIIWDSNAFSKHLKQKRIIEDDTDMRTLAQKLDVSIASISRCEHGGMPNLKDYAKLCKYLGTSMDAFIQVK